MGLVRTVCDHLLTVFFFNWIMLCVLPKTYLSTVLVLDWVVICFADFTKHVCDNLHLQRARSIWKRYVAYLLRRSRNANLAKTDVTVYGTWQNNDAVWCSYWRCKTFANKWKVPSYPRKIFRRKGVPVVETSTRCGDTCVVKAASDY